MSKRRSPPPCFCVRPTRHPAGHLAKLGRLVRPVLLGSLLGLVGIAASPLSADSPAAAAPARGEADPAAARVADRLLAALGGEAAWNDTRFVRFGFFGRRQHLWDKWTGLHRVEGSNREGQRYVILQDTNRRTGRVWIDGVEASPEKTAEMLENGYGIWINDTYWLAMPFKLRDPGTQLVWEGEATDNGKTYDKLRLSFANVGLTPGDRYWLWINRETGLIDRWDYILEDMPQDGPPTTWDWVDWAPSGAVQFSSRRINRADQRELSLAPVAVLATVPEGVFTDPTVAFP